MNQSKTLIFFGNERLLVGSKKDQTPIFDWLINNGWTIKALITSEHTSLSRNYKPSSIILKAEQLNIPVYNPQSSAELSDVINNNPTDMAILVAYGKIVPQDVIDKFKLGIINIHPSLLPKLRGSSPIESALLGNEKSTGVSLMKLVSKMDAGPIFAQDEIELTPFVTKDELYEKIVDKAIGLLKNNLDSIAKGSLHPYDQNEIEATFTLKLNKKDGLLDNLNEEADVLEKKVRAYQNFPKPSINYKNKAIIVLKSHVVESNNDSSQLIIECLNGTYLCIDSLIAPNGKTMSGSDYLRGLVNNKN